MICPACQANGETSQLNVLGGVTTDMAYYPHYDEQGRYHLHDNNRHYFTWACSRGHKGYGKERNACWCGWEGNPGRITVQEALVQLTTL